MNIQNMVTQSIVPVENENNRPRSPIGIEDNRQTLVSTSLEA